MLQMLKELGDILAPSRCLQCLTENTWWCSTCSLSLRKPSLSCIVCATSNPHGRTCTRCREEMPLTGVVTVGSYDTPYVRRGIHWLKYKKIRPVATILAELLLPNLLTIAPWDDLKQQALLVPIPLHIRKKRERGFNQSYDIAWQLSRLSGIPVVPLLKRTKSTWTQSHLPADMREHNMESAFQIKTVPRKNIILLIDDVTTSGSTFAAAAKPLLESCHRQSIPIPQIWGCAIARG